VNNVTYALQYLSEENFKRQYGKDKPTKDTKIIFTCQAGKRSATMQEKVQKLGYKKYIQKYFFYNYQIYFIHICSYSIFSAYNYVGGWIDWQKRRKM